MMRGLTPPSAEHHAKMAAAHPQWEEGPMLTWRLKVPGGWLYRYGNSGAMAFVPEAGSYRPLDMNWPT
jgi:hypothetical protein